MQRHAYYEELKELARTVREEFGLSTPRVLKSDMRRIYKKHGIQIDLVPHFKSLRGAYFNDDLGPTVVLNSSLPEDPRVFTMAHELKHHLKDRDLGLAFCDVTNLRANFDLLVLIFAAELIYPEADFREGLKGMGVKEGGCTPECIVRLKRQTRTTLSYSGLAKYAVRFGFMTQQGVDSVQWKKLEEKLFGEPVYKRIQRYRKTGRWVR